jgi:dihydrofolate reductase
MRPNKAAYWKEALGAIADCMNRLPKLVCSRTLLEATWNNSTLVDNYVAVEVARLKQQGSGNMFVFGGANLSTTQTNESLFDEYRIGVAPSIHGRGKLLFGEGLNPHGLQLLEARSLSNGCKGRVSSFCCNEGRIARAVSCRRRPTG